MKILGISAFYHDSAAALLVEGQPFAAAQEERFTRIKHDSSFPKNAIEYCLREGQVRLRDVDHVVFYEKPLPKFERLIETYLSFAPAGYGSFRMAIPVWIKQKLFQKTLLESSLRKIDPDWAGTLLFTEHHQSHAASAFFASPFESAAVLTMDGVGEWPTTSLAVGQSNELTLLREIHFPHSLGLLYSAFTYYTGFKVNSGEYKLMGLAPYGRPLYTQKITAALNRCETGWLVLVEHGLFQLLHRPDHDQPAFSRAVRRPSAPAGGSDHPAGHGSGGLDSAGA